MVELDGSLKTQSNYQSSKLSIDRIIGTSAKSSNHFCIQDNVMAYTASGGVVICELDLDSNRILLQRFFCANNSSTGFGSSPSSSSANAYLNKAYAELKNTELPTEVQRDRFGFPISSESMAVVGSSTNSATDLKSNGPSSTISDNDLSSPSKFKERVRSISCVSISPNKKLLAIGESGYQPRILMFSLAPDSSSSPIATIHEHSFGINSITFSPDSKYFCSLGLINDGFINVWKIASNSINLHSSNRCSSIINQIFWHESYIIMLGLRLIKVWQVNDEGSLKPNVLKGRNVLLGSLINSNFICADVLNNDEVLLITDSNQLLLLKLNYENMKLINLQAPSFEFSSILVDYELDRIWFGSNDRSIKSMSIGDLKTSTQIASSPKTKVKGIIGFGSPTKDICTSRPILRLCNFSSTNLIYLSNSEEIILFDKKFQLERVIANSLIKNLSGIKDCYSNDLLVFSKDGLIKKVLDDNENLKTVIQFDLPSYELISNSITALDSNHKELILGDKCGNLYILEILENEAYKIAYQIKAHASTVNDILFFELQNYQIIASISRDRMIQIFYKTEEGWDILQTLPTHNGNLLKIQHHHSKIYVCSSDRTISIHKFAIVDSKIRVSPEKIISIKSSPINIKIFEDDLIVSTNDKNILIYKISDGYEFKKSLKLLNDKTNESLLVENFIIFKHLLIASSSDKSLRVFNYTSGKPISAVWGHSDIILSLILKSNNELISISNDGCLFKWNFKEPMQQNVSSFNLTECSNDDIIPLYSKVTRKIIPAPSVKTTPMKSNNVDITTLSPSSPTPRLSNATLKRLEAKQKSNPETSPLRYKPLTRPQTTLSPTRNETLRSVRSTSRSPTRSPSRSPVKRNMTDFSMKPQRNSIISSDKSKEVFSFIDKSIEFLDALENYLKNQGISIDDKLKLNSKINDINKLLNYEESITKELNKFSINGTKTSDCINVSENANGMKRSNEVELLERYSDKLLSLFDQKLNQKALPLRGPMPLVGKNEIDVNEID